MFSLLCLILEISELAEETICARYDGELVLDVGLLKYYSTCNSGRKNEKQEEDAIVSCQAQIG